ncbi:MAG: GNAT family N-acetyltransferase, partial [Pirellulaceae bacterium]
ALRINGLEAVTRPGKRVAEIDLTGGYSSYLAGRKGSFRQNLKRLTRRAEKAGITFHRFRPAAGLTTDESGYYDQIVDLAERSWQGAAKEGYTLSHPRVAPFLREAHTAAAQRGMVDIAMLCQGEQVIAYCYNYHHQGCVQGLRTGYDREYRDYGPGTVLYGLMLEEGAERGDQRYDLGADHQPAKRHWATHWNPTQTVRHYRPAGAGRSLALKWSHRCKGALQKLLAGL